MRAKGGAEGGGGEDLCGARAHLLRNATDSTQYVWSRPLALRWAMGHGWD
jgi:hypothetical protein